MSPENSFVNYKVKAQLLSKANVTIVLTKEKVHTAKSRYNAPAYNENRGIMNHSLAPGHNI